MWSHRELPLCWRAQYTTRTTVQELHPETRQGNPYSTWWLYSRTTVNIFRYLLLWDVHLHSFVSTEMKCFAVNWMRHTEKSPLLMHFQSHETLFWHETNCQINTNWKLGYFWYMCRNVFIIQKYRFQNLKFVKLNWCELRNIADLRPVKSPGPD